jgi:Protein of unknown function (DUF4232)
MRRTRTKLVTGIVAAIIVLAAVPAASAALHSRIAANCVRAQLGVRNNGSSGALGTIHGAWVFTNSSDTACTLNGYPDLQLYGPKGRPIPTTVVQDLSPAPAAVTLAPGASGTFFSRYNDVGPGPCQTSGVIQIAAPNADAPHFIPAQLQACGGIVHVSAVKAGVHHP